MADARLRQTLVGPTWLTQRRLGTPARGLPHELTMALTTRLTTLALGAALAVASVAGPPARQAPVGPPTPAPKLAPFMPTPAEVVDRMLDMAQVDRHGRRLRPRLRRRTPRHHRRQAATARAVSASTSTRRLIAQSRANAKKEGVDRLVEFRQQDALTVDLSPASVVTLYLLTEANLQLRPRLQAQLKPGSRVVSHQFGMGDWVPTRTETVPIASGRRG